jgi:predicted transcriptional regulator
MKKQLNNKELLERNKILNRKLRDSIKYYSATIKNLEKEIKRLKNLIQKTGGDSN